MYFAVVEPEIVRGVGHCVQYGRDYSFQNIGGGARYYRISYDFPYELVRNPMIVSLECVDGVVFIHHGGSGVSVYLNEEVLSVGDKAVLKVGDRLDIDRKLVAEVFEDQEAFLNRFGPNAAGTGPTLGLIDPFVYPGGLYYALDHSEYWFNLSQSREEGVQSRVSIGGHVLEFVLKGEKYIELLDRRASRFAALVRDDAVSYGFNRAVEIGEQIHIDGFKLQLFACPEDYQRHIRTSGVP